MSIPVISLLAGLGHGGLDQWKLNRQWEKDDAVAKAMESFLNPDKSKNDAAQPSPAQADAGGGSAQPSIWQQMGFNPGQSPQPQPNSAAQVGNYGAQTNIPVPTPSELIPQSQQQAAPPAQGDGAGQAGVPVSPKSVVRLPLPWDDPAPGAAPEPWYGSLVRAATGMGGAGGQSPAPAPAVAGQAAQPLPASMGDGSASVAGQGYGLLSDIDARSSREVEQAKKLAIALARSGNNGAAIAMYKQAQDKKYAVEDLKYGMRIANDPTGEEAQKLYKLIDDSKIPGTTLVTDPKTGVVTLQLQQPDGASKAIALSGKNAMYLGVAYNRLQRGDIGGLTDLYNIDKDVVSHAVAGYQFNAHLAQLNNSAANINSNIDYRNQRVAIDDRRYDVQERRIDAQQQKLDTKDAQENERHSAAAALVQDPTNPALQARYAAAGGSLADLGRLNGGDGNKPMEVKLADAFLQAGIAPDKKSAIQMAMNHKDDSPDKVRQQLYLEQQKLGLPHKEAAKNTDAAMLYLFPRSNAAPAAGGAASGSVGPSKAQLEVGQVYQTVKGPARWNGKMFEAVQ
ncbi:MAG: hypothetical protein LBI48_00760 [Burkholderiaceae bacterium]|jgi:hypothetical protein|nr:hypothetical protein [Burkholderiaceae bacterium]